MKFKLTDLHLVPSPDSPSGSNYRGMLTVTLERQDFLGHDGTPHTVEIEIGPDKAGVLISLLSEQTTSPFPQD